MFFLSYTNLYWQEFKSARKNAVSYRIDMVQQCSGVCRYPWYGIESTFEKDRLKLNYIVLKWLEISNHCSEELFEEEYCFSWPRGKCILLHSVAAISSTVLSYVPPENSSFFFCLGHRAGLGVGVVCLLQTNNFVVYLEVIGNTHPPVPRVQLH